MRIISFFDGAQSGTTPTIGNIKASDLVTYANDSAFIADQVGAPLEGNIYFNTTINSIRYYNGSSWVTVLDDTSSLDADLVVVDTISGLTATDAQAAFAEHQTEIETNATNIGTNTTNIGLNDTDITNLQSGKQDVSEKGVANGYAGLDGSGTVPAAQLPSYVDDVLEYANFAAFPGTGETGKIYIAIDTSYTYRWTGSAYLDITSKVDSVNGAVGVVVLDTDDVSEGTNKYFPEAPEDGTQYARKDATWEAVVSSGGGSAAKLIGGGNISWALGSKELFTGGTNNGGNAISTDTEWDAQSFSIPTTAKIKSIDINLINTASGTGTAQIDIHADTAGAPGAVLFSGGVVDLSTIPNVNALYNFPIEADLTGGTTYWLVIRSTGTGGIWNVLVKLDHIASGNRANTVDSGSNWTDLPADDLEFNINYADVVSFDNDFFLEFGGLNYSANTIDSSSFTLNSDKQCAYVTPNDTNPGGSIAVSTGSLVDVTDGDIVIARRDSDDLLIGDTTLILDGETRRLYDTTSGLIPEDDETVHFTRSQSIPNSTTTFFTSLNAIYDPNSAIIGGVYTFIKSGSFKFSGHVSMPNASTGFRSFEYRINGGGSNRVLSIDGTGGTTTTVALGFNVSVSAGDTIDFSCNQSSGSSATVFLDLSMTEISNANKNVLSNTKLQQQAVTAKYKMNGSTATPTLSNGVTTVIDFNLKDFDTHDAVSTGSGWVFTAGDAGYYEVSSIVALTTNSGLNSLNMNVQKNGSPDTRVNLTLTDVVCSGDTIIQLDAGETINVTVNMSASGPIGIQTADTSITVTSRPDLDLYGAVQNQEILEVSAPLTSWTPGSNVWTDLSSIILPEGTHELTAVLVSDVTADGNGGVMHLALSEHSGTTTTDHVIGDNEVFQRQGNQVSVTSANNAYITESIPKVRVTVPSGGKTYYIKAKKNGGTLNQRVGYKMTARKI